MHWRFETVRDWIRDFLLGFIPSNRRWAREFEARRAALSPAERDLWNACWDFVTEHQDEPMPPNCRELIHQVVTGEVVEAPAGNTGHDPSRSDPG